MLDEERLYIVAYDIAEPRRWRRVFKLMNATASGCSSRRSSAGWRGSARSSCRPALAELINHNADHVLLLDLGHADKVELRVTSLGKVFAAVERQPIIV